MPIPFWWMLNEMTQYLVFVLACNIGQIFALFWFWEKKRDNITKCSTPPISFIQKEIYKKCTRVHAYRPYAIHWGDFYLLDIPRHFCTWAQVGTPHRQKSYGFERLGYNPICWVIRKCSVNVGVTHVLWVILNVEFDGNIHFYVQLTLKSRSGQIRLNRQAQNFHSETCIYFPVLPQDSKNDIFYLRRLEMPEIVF